MLSSHPSAPPTPAPPHTRPIPLHKRTLPDMSPPKKKKTPVLLRSLPLFFSLHSSCRFAASYSRVTLRCQSRDFGPLPPESRRAGREINPAQPRRVQSHLVGHPRLQDRSWAPTRGKEVGHYTCSITCTFIMMHLFLCLRVVF